MRLLLIRHGETSANAEGRLQGHLDVRLSERGRRQSEVLAERLATLSIDALYTSPLLRARETADIVAARAGVAPVERPALMERNVGELAGMTRAEIIARYPRYAPARAEVRRVDVPGFEQDEDFTGRAMRELNRIIESHAGQTVAAVTHGGVIFTFCRQTLGLPIVRPGPFAVDNASVTIFDAVDGDAGPFPRPRIQLITLNDTCHLDGLRSER